MARIGVYKTILQPIPQIGRKNIIYWQWNKGKSYKKDGLKRLMGLIDDSA